MIRALTGSGLTGFEVWQKVVLTLWCLSCFGRMVALVRIKGVTRQRGLELRLWPRRRRASCR